MAEIWQVIQTTVLAAVSEVSVMTFWELIAVILAVGYLLLAMRTNIWCWAAAFFSTAIYTALFWHVSLLMESLLNVYYMAMAVYGFYLWRGGRLQSELKVVSWSGGRHASLILVTSAVSVAVGYGMATYTQASFPYIDAATTCFAVMTTYLVAKKVLENWLYWVVIDLVSIYLYFSKGLMLTSVLFVFYVGMAIAGYFMWRQKMQLPPQASQSVQAA
ncbi:nicotinamide riboside transporter PnuC [Shewanella waksmanii]|uniref:nicotinamide riboside transporter PnuC n=1 Tax=Shewanella waksmanii TaxID=213783 RepID=UPI003734DE0D